jgi:GR25 family glycosyltransferase involved in LPS biosynthesis
MEIRNLRDTPVLFQSATLKDESKTVTVEIIVISLLTSLERRRRIAVMLEGSGLNWAYFDAHASLRHAGLRYDPNHVKRKFGRTLSVPEVAICSSHVAALDEFIKRGTSDYVLIFEDDVIFDVDFPIDKFTTFCAEKGFNYVRLFGKQYAEAVQLGYFFDRHIVRFKTSPAGAQAYLMSRSGARSFIESFQSIDQPLDLAMDAFWRSGLPIYSIFPYPVIERYSPSSNLIPSHSRELDARQRLARFSNHVIDKSKKIWANIALKAQDRRMRQEIGGFRQIFDE